MNELTPGQIAASIAGHPLSGWPELRLLMLFLADDGREVVVRPMPLSKPLATAA